MHAIFNPCLCSIVATKLLAVSKESGVPVSTQAKPLPNVSTYNFFFFKYTLFKSVISNSPLLEGFKVDAISTTSLS